MSNPNPNDYLTWSFVPLKDSDQVSAFITSLNLPNGPPPVVALDANDVLTLYIQQISQADLNAGLAAFDFNGANTQAALALLLNQRDIALRTSDWTQAPDSPLNGDSGWLAYRAALWALSSVTDPNQFVLPAPPAASSVGQFAATVAAAVNAGTISGTATNLPAQGATLGGAGTATAAPKP